MSEIPSDLKYTKSHEWVRLNEDDSITIGITDHAQAQLGDLVYVELPEAGDSFQAGDACAVVESVKAASDVYCPLDGEVTAINDELESAPDLVNQDPFTDGWLFSIEPGNADQLDELMDADAYEQMLEDE